ncbi:NACHT domain-containing protein [Chryseobacterium sediminis]|uniref:NACHT domain-containing protein n=1 Tax=Chryseobacterium sediminis TaxID=1679494 RepID=A0A5B2UCE8_9FLAO|nr:hypothetical protein [Chryseobacterium sediminis]KAA2224007.1 hypothetical protein FW780_07365 [Chryseobacterium sediminis]
MAKKGGDFEVIALDFLEKIFQELDYEVVRKRIQKTGSQDGFDNLVEIVDRKFKTYTIYSECKDYSTVLNYSMAIEKIPHIVSTHKKIDLLLFISPHKNFSNTNEDSKLESFYEILGDECPVEFLTPESYIKEYFSLYPNLYKKVYKEDIEEISIENRTKLLQKFKKLIFSDKNLQKTIIEEEDRNLFIDDLKKDQFYISRSFRKYQERERFVFDNPDYEIKLEEQLNKSRFGVAVLGNPGSGKSHELKNFAIELWENRDTNNKIPRFRILKNFSSGTNFTDLLPENYKNISNLIIILDGIDEIHDITNFAVKLRAFIYDNQHVIESNQIKFVVSCRTNIYNNHIKSIDGFDICFINEVPENMAVNFLYNKYSLDVTQDERFSYWKFRDILQTPFYLELLGQHYYNTRGILLNKSKLLETYVKNRLDDDEKIKYLNDSSFSKAEILECSKKIALSMEAMQKSFISTSESFGLCEKKIDLSKNSFLQQNLDETWSFEYKNIQEYFVAKTLSQLDFEQIIDFIQIDSDTLKVHPTWYNVVSFLLNLELEKKDYERLVNWIIENDLELIFQVDSDRIDPDIRTKCLVKRFTEICIEKTLWLEGISEIARFSNTESSVDYLISQITNKSHHSRARITAIELLSYMSFSAEQINIIGNTILELVSEFQSSKERNILFLQNILKLFKNPTFTSTSVFYSIIFKKLQLENDKDVILELLKTMPEELIEKNLKYILNALDISIREEYEVVSYKHASTLKHYVFELLKQIENSNSLIIIYTYLIKNYDIVDSKDYDTSEFLDHLNQKYGNKKEIYSELVEIISQSVINDKISFYADNLLIEITIACDLNIPVFKKVLHNNSLENYYIIFFLSKILKEELFCEILEVYKEGNVKEEFLIKFRNSIRDNDFHLSSLFENYIESTLGYKFNEKLTVNEYEIRTEFYLVERQREFDILLNFEALRDEILSIFHFSKKKQFLITDWNDFYKKYSTDYNIYKNITRNSIQILKDFILSKKNGKAVKDSEIPKLILNYELEIMRAVENFLPKRNDTSVLLTNEQKLVIEIWCKNKLEKLKEIYGEKISKCIGKTSGNRDFLLFDLLYLFQRYFKFNIKEEFLLEMISLNVRQKLSLNFFPENFDMEKVNVRIIQNINHENDLTNIYIYLKHLVNSKKNLDKVIIDIKAKIIHSLSNNNYYYPQKLIELLYFKDIKFVNEIINIKKIGTKDGNFLEDILSMLIRYENSDYAETYIRKNYNYLIDNQIIMESSLIKLLINCNSEYGFKMLLIILENTIFPYQEIEKSFKNSNWQNFSNKNSISDLVKILELAMTKKEIIKLNSNFSPLRIAYEVILNICQKNDLETCEEIFTIIKNINTKEIKQLNGDLFYLSQLEKDLQDIIYNHKSKAFNLPETLKLIKDYNYIFY